MTDLIIRKILFFFRIRSWLEERRNKLMMLHEATDSRSLLFRVELAEPIWSLIRLRIPVHTASNGGPAAPMRSQIDYFFALVSLRANGDR